MAAQRVAIAASVATSFAAVPMAANERAMWLAIAEAHRNPVYPFGAVITQIVDGKVTAKGVNNAGLSPILHGEIVACNDYIARHGNNDWASHILYTTGEPCSMCMSALVWAGIGAVVFASPIDTIQKAGIDQIGIRAQAVIDTWPFYHGALLGGVPQAETDQMFLQRKRA